MWTNVQTELLVMEYVKTQSVLTSAPAPKATSWTPTTDASTLTNALTIPVRAYVSILKALTLALVNLDISWARTERAQVRSHPSMALTDDTTPQHLNQLLD